MYLKNQKNYQLFLIVCSRQNIFILILYALLNGIVCHPYSQSQYCSNRLENALERMRRRNNYPVKSTRSFSISNTPYSIYHSLYDQDDLSNNDNFYHSTNDHSYYSKHVINNKYFDGNKFNNDYTMKPYYSYSSNNNNNDNNNNMDQRQAHKLSVNRVDVEDLKVRMPVSKSGPWVQVDKCQFSSENYTLETRLLFPDLTLSGRVILHPSGGKCNMILRLRHAGIDFKTVPIGLENTYGEEKRRLNAASIRTDSQFADPGFISVFAHSCQGPTGIKMRQNSKRYYSSKPSNIDKNSASLPLYDIRRHKMFGISNTMPNSQNEENLQNDYDQLRHKRKLPIDIENDNYFIDDVMNFSDDILNISDDVLEDSVTADARVFASLLNDDKTYDNPNNDNNNLLGNPDEVNSAFIKELERLFSMGVRSLLTTYMQRTLQPAIKETLLGNLGYTISYG